MNTKCSACALIAAFVSQGPLLAIDVDNPPVGVFSDEWYILRIKGQKSGHAHAVMERVNHPGRDVIRSRTDMVMEMGRAGQGVKVEAIQQTEESLDGEPLAFANRMKLGVMPGPSTSGKIANGKVTVTTAQFGQQADKKIYDLPGGAMMAWAVYREQIKRGLKPGTKYELPLYEPSVTPERLTPTSIEILNRETIDLYGRKVEAVKTRQTIRIANMFGQQTGVETVTWVTDEGSAVRIEMSLMNLPIELVACTKSVALAPNDPAELMLDTLIWSDKVVDPNARKIVYRLMLKDKSGKVELPDLPETDMQKIGRRGKDEVRLIVTRRGDEPGDPGKAELTAKERQRYLAASSVVNYKDPAVAKLVKQAAGNEKDPGKLAERLCRFVGRYVKSKNLSVGFATASEVARSKEGDCTEHGILLAALGRAVGIPTRLVTGVVYADAFAGLKRVFVGHLWTQFWIDGRWVDLDAARGETVVDPTHIALSLSDAGDNSIADLVSSVWLNLGTLKLTVVSSEHGDESTPAGHRPGRKATSQPRRWR